MNNEMMRASWNDHEIARLMDGVPVVDAHIHYWMENGIARRSAGPSFDLLSGAKLPIEYLPSTYEVDRANIPIVAAVHVETWAVKPEEEIKWLYSILPADALPTAIVAGAELQSPGALAELERFATAPLVVGVRQILSAHSDPRYSYIDRDDLMQDTSWRRAFAQLSGLGLTFDIQVYASQFAQVAKLAGQYPETVIIIDHAGMPLGHDEDSIRAWNQELQALRSMPNVFVKISGIAMVDHHWSDVSVARVVETLLETFGPSRLMFGSNSPVDSPFGSLSAMTASVALASSGLRIDERRQLFGATAWSCYQLQKVLDVPEFAVV